MKNNGSPFGTQPDRGGGRRARPVPQPRDEALELLPGDDEDEDENKQESGASSTLMSAASATWNNNHGPTSGILGGLMSGTAGPMSAMSMGGYSSSISSSNNAIGAARSAAASADADNGSTVSLDFRDNMLPSCVEIAGDGQSEFVVEASGSTALKLHPGTYLKINTDFAAGIGGKMVNDYTLTMDIMLDSLPADSQALLQTSVDSSKFSEGEVLVYSGGGVGVFGEVGVPEAAVKEKKWTRVVVTLGCAPLPPPPASSAGKKNISSRRGRRGMVGMGMSMEHSDEDIDDDDDEGEFYAREAMRQSRSEDRVMTTYVNSKKCAVISSARRGTVGVIDGRMALDTKYLHLFASNRAASMPGVTVRYVELRRGAQTEEQVKQDAQKNRIYSSWDKDRQAELKRLAENVTLSVLFKKPIPVWNHPSALAEFGDAYLEGTGMEGGDLASSVAFYSLVLERLILHEGHGLLSHMTHDTKQTLNGVAEIMKSSKDLFRRYSQVLAQSQGNPGPQLVHFMKKFRKNLDELSEGEAMLVPAGIGAIPLLVCIEREANNTYRLVVVNADPNAGLVYHPSTASSIPTDGTAAATSETSVEPQQQQQQQGIGDTSNKIKYQTVLVVKDVSAVKVKDDAFWAFWFKLGVYQSKANTPDKLYDLLLSFVADRPLEQIVAESSLESSADWRAPQRAATNAFRCVQEACHYMMRRRGIGPPNCRQIAFAVRTQVLKFVEHDIQFLRAIRDNDRRVITLACQQLAYLAAKLGEERLLNNTQLKDAYTFSQSLYASCESMPCEDADQSANAALLDLSSVPSDMNRTAVVAAGSVSTSPTVLQPALHPYFDRFKREEDVNGLAGSPVVLPKYVPLDFLQLPTVVSDLEHAVEAIRICDRLCTLISVQGHCVKNRALHKVALIEQVFTKLLPMPLMPALCSASRNGSNDNSCGWNSSSSNVKCVWQTPMRYGLQLDITICLGRIMEHFMAAVFSLHMTKSKDALHLVITACIAACMDVTLRKVATDQPSEFCLHLMGRADGGRGNGYGIQLASFAHQSSSVRLHSPHLAVARTAVLDYFDSQKGRLTEMFKWNENHRPEQECCAFLAGICEDLAFPTDTKSIVNYIMTSNSLINKNYPEFHVYRDMSFYLKYVQNVDPRAFPPKNNFEQINAELKWDFKEGNFVVEAYMRNFVLLCFPQDPFKNALHRYRSTADPTVLASPHDIHTEDDVLHIKNLPSFKDCLSQQDSELLLSYLTVPYLRVPLVISLFATEDRVHSLQSEGLRDVLDAVLFEPGNFLPHDETAVPMDVPSSNKALLATPFGLLFNELYRSPQVILDSVLTLVKLAVNLDVGTVHSTTVPIVLYVLRIVARVDSFVDYITSHNSPAAKHRRSLVVNDVDDEEDSLLCMMRDVMIPAETLALLRSKQRDITAIVRAKVVGMLEAWCAQLLVECLDKTDDEIMDTNSRIACGLHAHLLLLHRNVKLEDYNFDIASTISSSFMYLSARHTWNLDLLGIPENEVFEALMVQRRNLIQWTRAQSQFTFNAMLEAVVRVTVGTGVRSTEAGAATDKRLVQSGSAAGGGTGADNKWAYIGGVRSVGRFTVASARPGGTTDDSCSISEIDPSIEMGIEVDFQTAQLTLKSNHLQALDTAIASDPDVQLIFGTKSMLAATVQSAEHRKWVHLVGRDHDVQYWCTPDERTAVVDLDRDYAPDELEPTEQWIVPLLEPVRLTYMVQPFVLQICLQEQPLPAEAEVAMLIGIHPKMGGTWKEIFVFKNLRMVQVYQVLSHGRRFYRVLEYTSNVKYSLRDMQPSVDDKQQPWPVWERHGAGHPYGDHWKRPLSCVITRGSDFAQNVSGGTETLLPDRLFYGVLPQALLDHYIFWQDEGDNIKGYPRDESSPHLIEIVVKNVKKVRCSLLEGVCGHVKRVMRKHRQRRMDLAVELVHKLGATVTSASPAISDSGSAVVSAMEDTWKFGFAMMQRIFALVDTCVTASAKMALLSGVVSSSTSSSVLDPLEEVKEFVDALRTSGAAYEDANDLVEAVSDFIAENIAVVLEEEEAGSGAMTVDTPSAASTTVSSSSRNSSSSNGQQLLEESELTMVNLSFAPSESKFFSLIRTLSRVENISHMLCWTRAEPASSTYSGGGEEDITIDLLELPRLKLSFREDVDSNGVHRLYSMDHVNLFVSNKRNELTSQLMQGMPHSLLMATTNDELHILVPAVDPTRPRIGTSPFSTELVLNRSESPDWYAAVESTAFLYPIHVSLSFLFSPTLSSSLYLLVLRFLNRSYEEVFRLANTIGTDVEFSPEESAIFKCLGYKAHKDAHPDAHACLLKIAVVIMDSPVACPFDLTAEMSRYITKLGHVNAVCRLPLPEEMQLLLNCVTDKEDPRFVDPRTQQPRYSEYEITVVKNRKFYLKALLAGDSQADCFVVPRDPGTRWILERNLSAVMMDPTAYLGINVSYSAPTEITAHASLDVMHKYWAGQENTAGHALNLGFLFLYELMTGTKRAKVLTSDCSTSMAVLLFEFMSDKMENTFLTSVLSLMCRFPQLRELLPRFQDTRQQKKVSLSAAGDDVDPISPLGTLLAGVMQVLEQEMADLLVEPPEYDAHPLSPPAVCAVNLKPWMAFNQRQKLSHSTTADAGAGAASTVCSQIFGKERTESWIIPCVSNFSCSQRVLAEILEGGDEGGGVSGSTAVTEATGNSIPAELTMSQEDISLFSSLPLAGLGLEHYMCHVTREAQGMPPIDGRLPFTVEGHQQAQSSIARSMLTRLSNDTAEFAASQNAGLTPKMKLLLPIQRFASLFEVSSAGKMTSKWTELVAVLDAAVTGMETLQTSLEQLRNTDAKYVDTSLSWLTKTANSVEDNNNTNNTNNTGTDVVEVKEEERQSNRLLFLLKRFSKQEAHLWLEFLFGSILSSAQLHDLTLANPFLTIGKVKSLTSVLVASIMHANRVGIANRCLADVRDLVASLLSLRSAALEALVKSSTEDPTSEGSSSSSSSKITTSGATLYASAVLKGESLARNLSVGRHYVEQQQPYHANGSDDICHPSSSSSSSSSSYATVSGSESSSFSGPSSCAPILPTAKKPRREQEHTYDPRFLLFEFTWNIVLRESQVRMVRDYTRALKSGTAGMVKQMIMGQGKTTVVCPLLTLMLGDGSSLIVQVVPPALLEFSRSVMRSTFSSIMHKRIFTLSFDRSSEIDSSMLKKLISAKISRGVVICAPTTVKSIMLKFLELCNMISDPSVMSRTQALENDVRELANILRLFKESVLIMDEVDLILHPMKSELNFPIGNKQELDFSPQRWQMPIHLIDGIFYASRGRMSVGFKQSSRAGKILAKLKATINSGYTVRALQRNPHVVLLNVDWYVEHLQPVLADWLYMWLEAQHLAGMSEALIKQFLLSTINADKQNDAFVVEFEAKLSPNHKKMLNLGRDWLQSYLPHILQKIDRVSFGIMNAEDYERALQADPRMPRTRAKLAIPFVGKDVPSRSSEFAHPDVIIGLTVLAYRYEGLRWTDFEDLVSNMRSTMTKELGPCSKRRSSVRYSRWVREAGGSIFGQDEEDEEEEVDALESAAADGTIVMGGDDGDDILDEDDNDDGPMELDQHRGKQQPLPPKHRHTAATAGGGVVVSLRLLKRSNEEQMKKLFNLFRQLPDAIHYYLENFIFPAYTESKSVKLSAAGQELGGEMLFNKRIGFSGTPSDLLPIELGRCEYERCSDGQMINVLCSPEICSCEVVPEGWSPMSLLQRIARAQKPTFRALIDTGALITGMTNLQVARTLLKIGLPWCEGVVYLDEYDRKMVLVRATGRVLKMAQCGVPASKRFAFYDQVHTTGMDIQHVIDAKAVLTVSKDMVFRDIAQGAYRMRGIGKGQTIHMMVIPEVRDLILRELRKTDKANATHMRFDHWGASSSVSVSTSVSAQDTINRDENKEVEDQAAARSSTATQENIVAAMTTTDIRSILCDLSAWLVINSMRSERVQFNQLCLQNVSNLYRKEAFSALLTSHNSFKIDLFGRGSSDNSGSSIASSVVLSPATHNNLTGVQSKSRLLEALSVFCEPIDFSLEECVPNVTQFSQSIQNKVDQHASFVVQPDAARVIQELIAMVASDNNNNNSTTQQSSSIPVATATAAVSSGGGGHNDFLHDEQERLLGAEMVQEQEREQEQEQEQEQEIEIEKYVDLAYARDHEEATPWLFSSLSTPLSQRLPQFYPASDFKLYKRKPLNFASSVMISNNYFDCSWSGARRVKNVVVVMDWLPDTTPSCITTLRQSLEPLSDVQDNALDVALALLDAKSIDSFDALQLQQLIVSAVHVSLSEEETLQLMQHCNAVDLIAAPPNGSSCSSSGSGSANSSGRDRVSIAAVRKVLLSGEYSLQQNGRCFVALSLAEAETIRCIIHGRIGATERRSAGSGSSSSSARLIDGCNTSIALRCLPTGFNIIDSSTGYCEATSISSSASSTGSSSGSGSSRAASSSSSSAVVTGGTFQQQKYPYMCEAAYESLRFFNCELFFSERQLNIALRALHNTSKRDRRTFFKHIIGCRRRLAKKWTEASVSKLFTIADQFGQLKQRSMSVRLRSAIQDKGMLLYDAFSRFNASKSGLLAPAEVWGGFHYLGIDMTAADILEFVQAADLDGDGNVSYQELVDILSDPDKQQGDDAGEGQQQQQQQQQQEDEFSAAGGGRGGSLSVLPVAASTHVSEAGGDGSLSPVALRRQRSSLTAPVPPRGEAELRALQLQLLAADDEEEEREKAESKLEEDRIKAELEAEEDERDRNQEGGRNPKIGPNFARFSFTNEILPRFVTTRGDCHLRVDNSALSSPAAAAAGTESRNEHFLKVFPGSALFVKNPFSLGNCGGRRLNQYTITFHVLFEAPAPVPLAPAGADTAGGGEGSTMMMMDDNNLSNILDGSGGSGTGGGHSMDVSGSSIFGSGAGGTRWGRRGMRQQQQQSPPQVPPARDIALFSTAAHGERNALVCATTQQARVVLRSGGSSSESSSSSSSSSCDVTSSAGTLSSAGKWSFVTLVVDCIEGTVELFVDGKPTSTVLRQMGGSPTTSASTTVSTAAAVSEGEDGQQQQQLSQLDGPWSLGEQFSLFTSKKQTETQDGGSLRLLFLQPQCLLRSEVMDLVQEFKRESQAGIVPKIVEQLMSMGFSHDIASWAARTAEGATVEDRVNAALSMLG